MRFISIKYYNRFSYKKKNEIISITLRFKTFMVQKFIVAKFIVQFFVLTTIAIIFGDYSRDVVIFKKYFILRIVLIIPN